MARPTKSDDKRTQHIDVRLSIAEKKHVEEAAKEAGLTPCDFIRLHALGTKPRRKIATPDREILLKGLAELNKIGSNLNQIARHHNRKSDSEGGAELPPDLLEYSLLELQDLSRSLLNQLDKSNGH